MKQKQISSLFGALCLLLACIVVGLPTLHAESEGVPQRSDIEDQYKWKVEDIYPNLDAWESDFAYLTDNLPRLEAFQGHLAESPEMLLHCLSLSDSLDIIIGNLYVYAFLKLDEDNRRSEFQELGGRAATINSNLGTAQSFIQPEILEMDKAKLDGFLEANKDLAVYSFLLEDLMRQKAHILSTEEEAILAAASAISRAPQRVFTMIDDADHKLGTIVDSNGEKIELTRGRYYKILEGTDRDLRRQANDTVQNSWKQYLNTLSATLGASLDKDYFYAKTRKYNSCLESALDGDAIPPSVVHNLVDAVNANLAPLHKLISLRKKMLGYDTLYTYDLSVPFLPESEKEYTYEEAKETVLKGLKPMGEQYLKDFEKGLGSGWIDVFETEGKGSGGYCWGTYTSHPYILLNFNNKLEDLFTLAHEMGHALNAYYANQREPYVYHNQTLFTAEVASTTNEAVLMKYMLANAKDKNEKIVLLDYYIRQIRGTFFTQVMFTEFELAIHERIESGGAVSADYFRETYREIMQKYYGPDLVIGPDNDMSGMKIGHFYRQYYVFKYATGYATAQMISQKILEGDKAGLDAFMNFMATGTSKYPMDILVDAGVDLNQPEAVERTIALFGELVDELEKLLLEG